MASEAKLSIYDPIGHSAIKDPWVCVFVGVSWAALIVSWKMSGKTEFRINSVGMLVKVEKAEHGKDKKQHEKPRFLYHPEGGTPRVRTFAAFCDGSDPPPPPGVTFQQGYSASNRSHIYRTLLQGSLMRCWRFVVICGLLATTLSWWTRTCEAISIKLNTKFMNFESVFGNLQAAAAIHALMIPLASFVLALYINTKMGWFDSVISQAWSIQGKMGDLALILGSVGADDEVLWAAKYRVYRYLNLAHFFLYQAVSEGDLKGASLDDLMNIGLIAPDELRFMQRSASPRSTALLWVGMTFQELADSGKIQPCLLPRVLEVLRECRGSIDTLAKELTRVTPVSFVQLLQLMVDILMLLTPPALAFSLETKRDGVTVYLWPALGSMVLSLFYQGGMKLICSMENPFGHDLDDLRSDWLLSATERAVYGYLTELRPPPLEVEVERGRSSRLPNLLAQDSPEAGSASAAGAGRVSLFTEEVGGGASPRIESEKLTRILPGEVAAETFKSQSPRTCKGARERTGGDSAVSFSVLA